MSSTKLSQIFKTMERSEENFFASEDVPVANEHRAFSTTHWSVVRTARNSDSPGAAAALEQLCAKYWYPIYVFVRRRGYDFHEAQDLTQAFFAYLLGRQAFNQADRDKGKFRSFLLAALMNFLNNEWDKKQTLKRGGQRQIISLDDTAEERYQHEPAGHATPETLFERRWALTLMEQVLARLQQEYAAGGKAELFAKLEPCLTAEASPGLYAERAPALGMTEGATRVALHRLRRRFGELLRQEIAQTVASPAEVEDEIRHLFAAISN